MNLKWYFIYILLLSSCIKDQVFLTSNGCAISSNCVLSLSGSDRFKLSFSPLPKLKEQSYGVTVHFLGKEAPILTNVSGELIGMSMNMPPNRFNFKSIDNTFETRVIPGVCIKRKMSWRLKIVLEMSDKKVYYTFINYDVESL